MNIEIYKEKCPFCLIPGCNNHSEQDLIIKEFKTQISILSPRKSYPFRSSYIKKARCGTCQFNNDFSCLKGNEILFPTMAQEHNCKDYQYKKDSVPIIPKDKILLFRGLSDKLKECNDCTHNFENRCEGLKWFPYTKHGECEFFRHKNTICKNAVPYLQYENHIRNNYCKLPPHLRDDP